MLSKLVFVAACLEDYNGLHPSVLTVTSGLRCWGEICGADNDDDPSSSDDEGSGDNDDDSEEEETEGELPIEDGDGPQLQYRLNNLDWWPLVGQDADKVARKIKRQLPKDFEVVTRSVDEENRDLKLAAGEARVFMKADGMQEEEEDMSKGDEEDTSKGDEEDTSEGDEEDSDAGDEDSEPDNMSKLVVVLYDPEDNLVTQIMGPGPRSFEKPEFDELIGMDPEAAVAQILAELRPNDKRKVLPVEDADDDAPPVRLLAAGARKLTAEEGDPMKADGLDLQGLLDQLREAAKNLPTAEEARAAIEKLLEAQDPEEIAKQVRAFAERAVAQVQAAIQARFGAEAERVAGRVRALLDLLEPALEDVQKAVEQLLEENGPQLIMQKLREMAAKVQGAVEKLLGDDTAMAVIRKMGGLAGEIEVILGKLGKAIEALIVENGDVEDPEQLVQNAREFVEKVRAAIEAQDWEAVAQKAQELIQAIEQAGTKVVQAIEKLLEDEDVETLGEQLQGVVGKVIEAITDEDGAAYAEGQALKLKVLELLQALQPTEEKIQEALAKVGELVEAARPVIEKMIQAIGIVVGNPALSAGEDGDADSPPGSNNTNLEDFLEDARGVIMKVLDGEQDPEINIIAAARAAIEKFLNTDEAQMIREKAMAAVAAVGEAIAAQLGAEDPLWDPIPNIMAEVVAAFEAAVEPVRAAAAAELGNVEAWFEAVGEVVEKLGDLMESTVLAAAELQPILEKMDELVAAMEPPVASLREAMEALFPEDAQPGEIVVELVNSEGAPVSLVFEPNRVRVFYTEDADSGARTVTRIEGPGSLSFGPQVPVEEQNWYPYLIGGVDAKKVVPLLKQRLPSDVRVLAVADDADDNRDKRAEDKRSTGEKDEKTVYVRYRPVIKADGQPKVCPKDGQPKRITTSIAGPGSTSREFKHLDFYKYIGGKAADAVAGIQQFSADPELQVEKLEAGASMTKDNVWKRVRVFYKDDEGEEQVYEIQGPGRAKFGGDMEDKREWPELVGALGTVAKEIIERERESKTEVVILLPGAVVTKDVNPNRVRIPVSGDGPDAIVIDVPRIG